MPTAEKQKIKSLVTLHQPLARKVERGWNYSTATTVPEMALYYGFSPAPHALKLERQDERLATDLIDRIGPLFSVREKIALLRQYFARNTTANPLAVFSEKFVGRGDHTQAEYHLDVIGTAEPTAETLLMKLCYEIARDHQSLLARRAPKQNNEVLLEINSVGERESFSRFSRDVTAHFHRHLAELHADCRQDFKRSSFAPVHCNHSECQTIRATMPESVGFLSEPSRHHFMHVLEHLEATDLPYSFDKELLVEPDIVQHTIFRISLRQPSANPETPSSTPSTTEPVVVARGARWGGLARRMGFKKDILGASAVVRLPIHKNDRQAREKKMTPPVFYFIHIGYDALLKSLNVIETLRRAKIGVYHALLKDTMAVQLGNAEYLGVPYILIMGQKESNDNTILVRHMRTRSQETVSLARLAEYLREILKK